MSPRTLKHLQGRSQLCRVEPAETEQQTTRQQTARPVFEGEPYPVNLNLFDLPVLVVGGGPVAARKIEALKRAGAEVTVVAPDAIDRIADDHEISWHRRPYRQGEAGSYRLVITATNDPAVNAQVAGDGTAANVFVNSADDPENCSFTLMSVLRRGDLQITVSTSGRSPALSRWMRRRLGEEIDSSHVELLDVLEWMRPEARAAFGTSEVPGWQAALDDGLLELVRDGQLGEARSRLRRYLRLPEAAPDEDPAPVYAEDPVPS